MRTPAEKYQNDIEYNHLVNMLTDFIGSARFTPSELREACIFACTEYERRTVRRAVMEDPRVNEAVKVLNDMLYPSKQKD